MIDITATTQPRELERLRFRRYFLIAAVGALIVLGTILRFSRLGATSLWADEAASMAIVTNPDADHHLSWPEFLRSTWSREFNMVFYYALLRGWIQLGNSEAVIRSLSVIPGIFNIFIIYLLGVRLLSQKVGMVAAFLLAIHVSHLAYSQEARSYSLVTLLCSLSFLFLWYGVNTGQRRYWVLYTACTVLAIYTHLFAVFFLPAQWFSIVFLKPKESRWKSFLVSTTAVLLLAAPALFFILTHDGGQIGWVEKTNLRDVAKVAAFLAGVRPRSLWPYIPLLFLAVREFIRILRQSGRSLNSWSPALLLSWLWVPLFVVLIVSIRKPILYPRFLIFCIPACVLVAAWGLCSILNRSGFLIYLGVLVFFSLAYVRKYYQTPKEDWRAAAAYVFSHARPGDVVALPPTSPPWAFHYYLARWDHNLKIPIDSNPDNAPASQWINTLARGHQRIWLVQYSQVLTTPGAAAINDAFHRELDREDEYQVFELQVELYQPHGVVGQSARPGL